MENRWCKTTWIEVVQGMVFRCPAGGFRNISKAVLMFLIALRVCLSICVCLSRSVAGNSRMEGRRLFQFAIRISHDVCYITYIYWHYTILSWLDQKLRMTVIVTWSYKSETRNKPYFWNRNTFWCITTHIRCNKILKLLYRWISWKQLLAVFVAGIVAYTFLLCWRFGFAGMYFIFVVCLCALSLTASITVMYIHNRSSGYDASFAMPNWVS